jgi:2-polyprenyl-3-methyl-5-hydroxy-6-metoxy-1,4-benzoquinol methylase
MTGTMAQANTYSYDNAGHRQSYDILLPAVLKILAAEKVHRIFDLGCGAGTFDQILVDKGFDVIGVDPSESGITLGQQAYPSLKIHLGSAYDDLAKTYGTYPSVLSLEVVEHLYDPHRWAKTAYDLIEDGGVLIVSTPYHGWLKNVAIAASGKFDSHVHPLNTHGHIKFWSIKTLNALLLQAGFHSAAFTRVGRIPPLACSILALARKGRKEHGQSSPTSRFTP